MDTATIPTKTSDDVMLAIAESTKYLNSLEFYFNKKKWIFSLEQDKFDYQLPEDFMGVVGNVSYKPSVIDSYERPLSNGGVDLVEQMRFYHDDYTGGLRSGQPSTYAVDDSTNKMLISPIPTTGEGTITFRYLANLGVIKYKHDGTNFIFYEPFTGNAIAITYTNPWFEEGFDALRERSMYYLWSRIHGGTPESDIKAQRALLQSQDAIRKLSSEGSRRQSIQEIRRWI